MKDEEFKQRLSEVAEWEIPKLSLTTIKQAKQKARGRRSAEDKYQEEHEQVFAEIFDGINPTAPVQLLKVKAAACDCEDCGAHCPNGRHKEKKLYQTGVKQKKNWRERCVTCGLHQNPFTGKFELTINEASRVWTDYLRDRKGEYKSKFARAKEELAIKASDPNAIEDDVSVITFYPDSRSTK
jgi:hypothetical protein